MRPNLDESNPQGVAALQRALTLSDLAEFGANLLRASSLAYGAVVECAFRQAGNGSFNPDPLHLGPSLSKVMFNSLSHPDRFLLAQAGLMRSGLEAWGALVGGLLDPSISESPSAADRRFVDPAWERPLFRLVRDVYAANAQWLQTLAGQLDTDEPLTKRRIEFFTKMLTDAFSPSNFLGSNPVALEEAIRTKGASLVRGMENFAADLKRGNGQLTISQTDMSRFKVGENVATAPGKIIFQNEIFQLLQFAPSSEQVHEMPLLMVTPWINKYYIVDLQPENSMIRWLTSQGFTVFLMSWVNPDARLAEKTFEDYMREGVLTALEKVMEQTGSSKVNTVGYCIGGTLLSCAMAYLVAHGADSPVNSATFFAAQQDFSEAGDLLLFTDEDWLREVEKKMDEAGGILPGEAMAAAFNMLRANDLTWSFFVSNYLMGKAPKAFDLLFWNADQTRMPKALHLWYLREFYKENKLARGELVMGGVRLDLSKVTTPIYVQASKEDHIAPFPSIYRGARLFGGPVTFTLAGSGHIAGVINHPDAHKYQHWINPELPETPEAWLAGAEERPGSWWPHWGAWLAQRSGPIVPARDPSAGPLAPIEDAPGSYVQVRVSSEPMEFASASSSPGGAGALCPDDRGEQPRRREGRRSHAGADRPQTYGELP